MNDSKNFFEEIEKKKRKIIENSSLKQKLVFCFLKNFNEDFCNIDKNKLRTIEEKLFYSILCNKKILKDNEISWRVKQLNLNNILELLVYIKYNGSIGKNDKEFPKLSPIETFILKTTFPSLKIKESVNYVNSKKYLSLLASKLLNNKKISKEELIDALKEADELIDIYILEQAYINYFSDLMDIDKEILKTSIQSILNFYRRIKNTLKICALGISIFIILGVWFVIQKYGELILNKIEVKPVIEILERYSNVIDIGALISFISFIGFLYWLFFLEANSYPDDVKKNILSNLKHSVNHFLNMLSVRLLKFLGFKVDLKFLSKIEEKFQSKKYNEK